MTRFIALVSGKGGVGKTSTTVNLGHCLAKNGKKVVLVDANLATANLGLHLGVLHPKGTVNQFLRGENDLRNVLYEHEAGFSFIPASSSYLEFKKTDPTKIGKLFKHLDKVYDYVLVDAPSGLGPELHELLEHTDETLIVTTAHLTSIMEALKTIKVAESKKSIVSGVVLNMSHGGRHEMSRKEVEEILGSKIIAEIKKDRKMLKALHRKIPLSSEFWWCRNAREFGRLAKFVAMDFER